MAAGLHRTAVTVRCLFLSVIPRSQSLLLWCVKSHGEIIMTKGRLEAFSDGVIAIIITITVLLIDLPAGNDWPDLLAIMPIIISYTISFTVVGTNWVNHHHLMQAAGSVNGKMLWANLLYLLILSFIPVTTGWVGRSGFSIIPVRVYVITNLASVLSYILLQYTVVHASDCAVIKTAAEDKRKERWTIVTELIALAVSFIPIVHYISCPLLVAAVAPWIIPDLRMKRVIEMRQAAEQESEE